MANEQHALARAEAARAKMQYDQQVVAEAGPGSSGLDAAGPPTWSKPAWDAFHAQYGRWPFSASELPPSLNGCPDWAYERMGLRKPPIEVRGMAIGGSPADGLAIWGVR